MVRVQPLDLMRVEPVDPPTQLQLLRDGQLPLDLHGHVRPPHGLGFGLGFR